MQTVIQQLNKLFSGYFANVNAKYEEKTKVYNSFFENTQKDDFYRGIMYVINSFLLDKEKNKLFLQIPLKGLGGTDKDKTANFNTLLKIVADCLHMATYDSLYGNIKCPEENQWQVGTWLFTNKKIKAASSKSPLVERFWKISLKKGIIDVMEPYQHPNFRFMNHKNRKNAIIENIVDTIRIKSDPGNANNPVRKRLSAFIDYVKNISVYKLKEQYTNALIVSFNNNWKNQNIPIEDELFYGTVDFTTSFPKKQGKQYDIIVFVGDNKYNFYKQKIDNLIALGYTKKVVFIGSQYFEGYKPSDDPKLLYYPFSFREIFEYFSGNFPNIELPKLDAQWLFSKLETLRDILSMYNELTEDQVKNILARAAFPMLDMNFQNISMEDAENLSTYLEEECGLELDENSIENIKEEYLKFSICEKTSKRKEYERIQRVTGRNSNLLLIPNHFSFRNKVNKFVKDNNTKSNHLVIDVKGDWKGFVDVLAFLLHSGAMGTYHLLSYIPLRNFKRFMLKEIDAYNAKDRKKLLDGLALSLSSTQETINTPSTDLADYYDNNLLDELISKQWDRIDTFKYTITMDNKSTDDTSGDVIYYGNRVPIDQLEEDQETCLPAEIIYYKTPNNFRELMRIYYNFEEGKDIEYYSSLWKMRLREYCQKQYNGNAEAMRKKEFSFLPKSQISNYIRDNCETAFPSSLRALARKLQELNLITESEMRYLVAAYNAQKNNSSKGGELKSSLYDYQLKKVKSPMLQTIEKNAKLRGQTDFSIDAIINSSLVKANVTKIVKNKTNNNENE